MHVLVKYKLFKEHARRNNKDLIEFLMVQVNAIGNILIEALAVIKLLMKAEMDAERKV